MRRISNISLTFKKKWKLKIHLLPMATQEWRAGKKKSEQRSTALAIRHLRNPHGDAQYVLQRSLIDLWHKVDPIAGTWLTTLFCQMLNVQQPKKRVSASAEGKQNCLLRTSIGLQLGGCHGCFFLWGLEF
jgi:hypothetical protein